MIQKTRYDSVAVRLYGALIDPLLWVLRPRIVRLCCGLGAATVLDIASATGAQCRMLGRAGIQTTGIDLAESMVAAARRRGGRNTHYIHGSACSLPFDAGSFDASLLLLALHEHEEEERKIMLAEALRVLRPAGHLIIADYTRPPHTVLHAPWHVIRFIEEIAGSGHRAGFKDFIARGGLAGLLDRHHLAPVAQSGSHFSTIGIAVIREVAKTLNDIGNPFGSK
jgi:SAM-dependent methyltransferase